MNGDVLTKGNGGPWKVRLQTAAIILATLLPALGAVDQNRFNVLFIAIDDLRPELGCYGVEAAQSPNLDHFATQSLLFTHHYVQVPTCGASRFALLTGRSPSNSGVTRNNAALYSGNSALNPEVLSSAQSMPELFRRSGYQTVCIGKISHTPDGRVFAYNGSGNGHHELPNAWNDLPTPFGPWNRGWGTFFAYANGHHREDGKGHQDLMEFVAEKDEDLPDGLMAQTTIEQLRQFGRSQERFFIGLGFFKPHLPFVATRGDWDAFANTVVAPPENPTASGTAYWHRSGEFYRYNAPFPKTQPLSKPACIIARRAYLACVRYVDRQVGKVLRALDEFGLANNTVVVVWGDHGWHLGERQIWGKHSPFEEALRSVLLIRVPNSTMAGTRTDALVETTDLYPTLVDLCQPRFTATSHPLDGRSLRPILEGSAPSLRPIATSFWGNVRSIRNETHRLIATVQNGIITQEELYAIENEAPIPVTLRQELRHFLLQSPDPP